MNAYQIVKRDSQYFVTRSYSPKQDGPFNSKAEAKHHVRVELRRCPEPYCGCLMIEEKCEECGYEPSL